MSENKLCELRNEIQAEYDYQRFKLLKELNKDCFSSKSREQRIVVDIESTKIQLIDQILNDKEE